jgi:hypothetical protein
MSPHKKINFNLKKYSDTISLVVIVLLVILMIGVTIQISGPLPQRNAEGMIITPQVTPVSNFQTIRGKAPDILETTPTSGVILASLLVVFIVLAGTAIVMRSQK